MVGRSGGYKWRYGSVATATLPARTRRAPTAPTTGSSAARDTAGALDFEIALPGLLRVENPGAETSDELIRIQRLLRSGLLDKTM